MESTRVRICSTQQGAKASRTLALVAVLVASAVGCRDHEVDPDRAMAGDGGHGSSSQAGSEADARSHLRLAASCADNLDDVYKKPTGLPKYDASKRGDVVRCAVDRTLSVADIQTTLAADSFADVEIKSAVRVYRIAYRTDRLLGHEGLTTALVFLPERPIADRAPVIVGAHGYNGPADSCRFSTQFALTNDEWRSGLNAMGMMLALSSYGYPVIAPDYPGSPSTVFVSEDEAHSVLDGTRAMRHLLAPGGTSDQVVLVGHSQGGHAVLSAQALAASYGLAGRLVAVVPFAPFWLAGRSMGAFISSAFPFTTAEDAGPLSIALTYLYSHAELYDGSGSGLLHYQPSKRDAAARYFDSSGPCVTATSEGPAAVKEGLMALGATTTDFLEPEFISSLGTCGISDDPDSDCTTEPAATWIERFRADRPASDPKGAEILFWLGGRDQAEIPPVAQCAIDKITSDLSAPGTTARLTVCADRDADHETLLSNNMAWTARWIASRTIGAPEPEVCPAVDTLQQADGEALACPGIPNTD